MAEPPVVNASPLIYLARAGFIELLRIPGESVVVPQAVADEILRRGKDDPAAAVLASTPWLRIAPGPPVPPSVQSWDLGPGESSVLAWALAHAGSQAILDDLQARRCAAAHRLPVRGTLGLVLVAKQRGVVPAARPVLEKLRWAGMYLSDVVRDRALGAVGE